MRLLGIFGGTFDPVHCGHLRTLVELQESCGFDELRVVPCGRPPHRPPPVAPDAARMRMLETALEGLAGITLDPRELGRPGPSWTVDTLMELRAEQPDAALALLLGWDAFAGIPGWHRWEELPGLAHLVVARRPGPCADIPDVLHAILDEARGEPADLREARCGRVIFCETSQLDISSSHLRGLASAARSLRWLVPETVERLIEENEWYRVRT